MFKMAAGSTAMQSVLAHAAPYVNERKLHHTRAVVSYKVRHNNNGTERVYRYVEYRKSVGAAVRAMQQKYAQGVFLFVEVVIGGTPVDQLGNPEAKTMWLAYEAMKGRVESRAGCGYAGRNPLRREEMR